jgi:sugar phosphate permease
VEGVVSPLAQHDRVPPAPSTTETPIPHRLPLRTELFGRVRGRILLLLCAMYFITYVDRVNISTAAPYLQSELHLSNTQLGMVLSAFAVPYAFFQLFGGWIADRFGPRRVLAVVGLVWGLATIATGFAVGLVSLFAARLALGFGEGASFPTATHAMTRWLPADRRGFGQGITHAFSRFGNALAPLGVAALIAVWSWRASFWLVGAVSLVWLVGWIWYFRDSPADHSSVGEQERAEAPAPPRVQRPPVPWRALLRRVLPVTAVDFCYGWTLWVYLTWIPSFFKHAYGLKLESFALFTTLVLIAGVAGDLGGGMITDALLRRTGNLRFARRSVLVTGLLGSFAFIVPTLFVHGVAVVTVCLAVAFFLLETTNSVLWSVPMDLAPDHAGTASGLMNTGFGAAGIVSPFVFGLLIDATGSWQVPFAVSAALLLVGALLALRLDPTRPITA